jgi:hypothetical protein
MHVPKYENARNLLNSAMICLSIGSGAAYAEESSHQRLMGKASALVFMSSWRIENF